MSLQHAPSVPSFQTMLLGFGKHKDKTFAHVIAHEPDYCSWILRNCGPDKSQAFHNFADFLRANSQKTAPAAAAPATPVKPAANPIQPQKTPKTLPRASCASASSAPVEPQAAAAPLQPAADTPLSCITYAVLDTETTGFLTKDRVVEVSVQRVAMDGRPPEPIFSSMVNPGQGVNMSSEAATLTGITNDMIHAAGVPSFSDVHPVLMKQLEGCVIVAHNASFDRRLITQSCDGHMLPPIQPWLCSLNDLSKRILPLARHKLVDVCGHYGISINSAHSASGDVEALAKALPHLLADAERVHGVRTWGDLQRFIGQRSKKLKPIAAVPVAGGAAGGGGSSSSSSSSTSSSSSSSSSSSCGGSANISDMSIASPPRPYDASAPCGAHEWDTPTRKWNGNMCVDCRKFLTRDYLHPS